MDFVKRTIQIVGGSLAAGGRSYTENLTTLQNEAGAVKAAIINEGKTTWEKVSKMKTSGGFKKIVDWYYDKSNDSDSDDFDPGFEITSDDDDNKSPASLSIEAIKETSNKQLNAMYEIGAQQAEMSIATTGELATTINNRSKEIVDSLTNVNKSLLSMDDKLRALVEIGLGKYDVRNRRMSGSWQNGVTDNTGAITLPNLYNMMKKTFLESEKASTVSLIKTGAGMMKPEDVLGAMFDWFGIKNKPIKQLGGKSIDQIGTTFNDTIGAVVQTTMSELMASPLLKKVLGGNINEMAADRNYATIANKQYNTKPAMWDGTARHTLVSIIPEYLKHITEGVTGITYNISPSGTLTKSKAPAFNQVTAAASKTSGISDNTTQALVKSSKVFDVNINRTDIENAGKALTMSYVMYLHKIGQRTISPARISTNDVNIINDAIQSLVYASGKSDAYWSPIVMGVMQRISTDLVDASNLAKNINIGLSAMINSAIDLAKSSSPIAMSAGKLSLSGAQEEFKNKNFEGSQTTINNARIGSASSAKHSTMLDYTRGIFGILNRGINVSVINNMDPKRSYGNYPLSTSGGGGGGTSPTTGGPSEGASTTGGGIPGGGFLKDIYERTVPRGLRLSMQMFGGKVSEYAGSPDDEGSIANSVSKVINPATSKVKEVFGKVKGAVKQEASLLKSNITDSIGEFADRQQLNRQMKEVSRSDQIAAQHALTLMQSALSDGNGLEDISTIDVAISAIQDPDLKNRIKSTIQSTIQKNSESGGGGKKSIISTILGKVLGGAKLLLKPVISILSKLFISVKTFGGKLFNLAKKIFAGDIGMITSGISNIGRGLFGQKARLDADGNEIEQASEGMIKRLIVKPVTAVIKTTTTILKRVGSVVVDFYGTLKDLTKRGIGALTKLVSAGAKSVKDLAKRGVEFLASKIPQPLKDLGGKVKDGVSNLFGSKGGNGLASNFMKGFGSVFTEARERKEKMRVEKLKVETVSDVKATEMEEMISGKKESIFTKLIDIAGAIRDKLLGTKESTSGSTTTTAGVTDVVDDDDTGVVTEEIGGGGEKPGFFSRVKNKAKNVGASVVEGAKGAAFDSGKIVGGITSALGGLASMVAKIVMGMEGFKALYSLVEQIFTEALKPLNKIFFQLIDVLKPIIGTIQEIANTLVEYIVDIAEVLIDVISPIIDALQPVIESLFEVLKPILDMIVGLVNVIMVPLLGVIQYVVVPILRSAGNTLKLISGVLQIGFGNTLVVLGMILTGIGMIAKLFGYGALADKGKSVMAQGVDFVKGGVTSVAEAIKDQVQMITHPFGLGEEKTEEATVTPESIVPPTPTTPASGGSIMDGLVGSGNITYNTINNTYGSGNKTQYSYGSYMNMSERGCGPIALADAYNRRTGSSIDPRVLAASMSGSGSYSPNRGTSVGGYLTTGNALGLNMRAGGVNMDSLKRATPNNPVTLIGSGLDYGTRKGNNHYVNVVGTDSADGAYVSNPLNGKVTRVSRSALIGGTKMGLYGSGDSPSYGLNDSIKSAMSELTSITGSLFSLFSTSDDTDIQSKVDAEKEKAMVDQTRNALGDDYAKYEQQARNLFMAAEPKRDGENDEQYEKRFQSNKSKYLAQATASLTEEQKAKVLSVATTIDAMSTGLASIGDSVSADADAYESSSSSSGSGLSTTFESPNGVKLAADSYNQSIFETDMTKTIGGKYSYAPVLEFFSKTSGDQAYVYEGAWYEKYGSAKNHTKEGVGTSGTSHSGVDIHTMSRKAVPLYATTDGTYMDWQGGYYNNPNATNMASYGNSIVWKDSAGYKHRYAHLDNTDLSPDVQNSKSIIGGKTLMGYLGNSGRSSGPHLHYQIQKPNGNNWVNVNPLTYFLQRNSWDVDPIDGDVAYAEGSTTKYASSTPSSRLTGGTNMEKIWNYLTGKGLSEASTAAIMGNLQAESGLLPNNLQNTYEKKYGSDNAYTADVDSGKRTRSSFMNDRAGYGLAQWTYYSRKAGLYDALKGQGKSIADLEGQVGYLWDELSKNYPTLFKKLVTNTDDDTLRDSTVAFMKDFENPANQSTSAQDGRYKKSLAIFNQLSGSGDIPPLNYSSSYGDDYDTTAPVIINRYDMGGSWSSDEKRDYLKAILTNTYNVRAERLEQLLEKILERMNNTQQQTAAISPQTTSSNNMFDDERIPAQINKLYIG